MYYVSFPQKGFKFSTTSLFRQNSSCSHSWQSQKKMTFYPELICVDHDNGHWCLRSVLAPITQCRWILFRAWHGSFSYLLFFSRMFFLRKHVSTQTSYFLLRQCPSTPCIICIIELTGYKQEWILRVYAKWGKSIIDEQILLTTQIPSSQIK